MWQLDVSNAFMHGYLKKNVHMQQPPGYIDDDHPHHVCKLEKSLYGLKQAPRAWFDRFTSQLLDVGFIASLADSSLFIYHFAHTIIYVLVYDNDIIIIGNSSAHISNLIQALSHTFDLRDLGSIHYFLGIQITYQIWPLSQTKYALDILHRFHVDNVKPTKTLSYPSSRLTPYSGTVLSNPTECRSIVRALQYLTFAWLDLAFSVHQLC